MFAGLAYRRALGISLQIQYPKVYGTQNDLSSRQSGLRPTLPLFMWMKKQVIPSNSMMIKTLIYLVGMGPKKDGHGFVGDTRVRRDLLEESGLRRDSRVGDLTLSH